MSDVSATTGLGAYVRWLADRGHTFSSYDQLWRWSIEDLEAFWASVWEYFGVKGTYERVLGSRGDARRRVVPRRAGELRGAHARRGPRTGTRPRSSPVRRPAIGST